MLGVGSAVGAVFAWFWSGYTWIKSQREQRAQAEYKRKEELYKELLRSIGVFYSGRPSTDADMVRLLEQYRLSWLYAPDDVVKGLNHALEILRVEVPSAERNREGGQRLSAVFAAIRQDLFQTVGKETELAIADFKHFS